MPSFTFLTAEWRHLIMMNYVVDPAILQPLVPPGTELDFHRGQTFLSLVGFRFLRTRILGLPVPLHTDFEEVNLRFYVRRLGPDGWRRGVVFISEIVPRWAIAFIARTLYGEPYTALPMGHRIQESAAGVEVEYGWRRAGQWETMRATATGQPVEMAAGSEEEFITEHYWGFSKQNAGGRQYQVEHPRWRVWPTHEASFQADLAALYGPQYVPALTAPPTSAFIAEGAPVAIRSYSPVER